MQSGRTRALLGLGLIVTACAAATIYVRTRSSDELALNDARAVSRDQIVEIGGVRRPITDVRAAPPRVPRRSRQGDDVLLSADRPPIPLEANSHVASVAEGLQQGNHPERLSSFIAPPPFDRAAYEADPESYLKVVEPGRVWQAAQPGPGVPPLTAETPEIQRIEQGESVLLKVKTSPGAPVTFTSFDLGAFENLLPTITVRADGVGYADARLTAIPGTIGRVRVLAGSPLASGRIQFLIEVGPPRRPTVRSSDATASSQ
jgi:hypothetical protein